MEGRDGAVVGVASAGVDVVVVMSVGADAPARRVAARRIPYSAATPTAAPITEGRTATKGAWRRVVCEAYAPMSPNTAMPPRASGSRRPNAMIPTTMAYTVKMEAMPTSSAILSLVPNQSMARSFTRRGTASITRSPTSSTGDWNVRDRAATISATASATSAATTPATAPSDRGRREDAGAPS